MSAPSQDPTQWLRDLMKAEPAALWLLAIAAGWTRVASAQMRNALRTS